MSARSSRRRRWPVLLSRFAAGIVTASVIACFPTFQTARVDPGFRLDAGATAVADRARSEPADYLAYLAPAYGFGHRVEIGVPVGVYMQHGLRRRQNESGQRHLLLLPYVKVALHDTSSREHVAVSVQCAALIIPSIFGVRYGHDFGSWEPQVGVTIIRSGGPAGDDPMVTRYQEEHQSLIAASVGATWNRGGYPGVEVGVLRNAFDESTWSDQGVAGTRRRTLYDLYVGMRVSTGTLRQKALRKSENQR